MFKTRLLSGIVLVILALVLIIAGKEVLLFSTLAISCIGMYELYRVFKIEKSLLAGLGYIAAIVFYCNLEWNFIPDIMILFMGFMILLMFVFVFAYPKYHANDVILSPDQIPMAQIDYAFLNEPAQVIVRQLLVAKAKETLGIIRGKYSGKVNIPQAEMTMDYQMLIQQGKEEYDKAMEALMKRLERLRPVNMMKEQADLMESNVKIQSYTPLGIFVI